jgi:indoleamine 2,3-dioxygenase
LISSDHKQILPPAISVPFLEVSEHLELPPVATYAALCLWNWNHQPTETDIDFENSDSLRMTNSMTGTDDEEWFYLVSVLVEAEGAPAILVMLNAIQAVAEQDHGTVIEALHELQRITIHLGKILEQMYERCKPSTFYHKIRPMLAGSKNMDAAGLPRGVYYDLGNGEGEWMQLRGGSNAQSSLIQFVDAVLGVVHMSAGETSLHKVEKGMSFHEEMRDYMPGPHRRFLEKVTKLANIRQFALAKMSHPLQADLAAAYQAAVQALSNFRGIHMQLVARYIIIPSRQAAVPGRMNLAVASQSEVSEGKSFTGTGGTDLVPFLKQTREETDRAGQL